MNACLTVSRGPDAGRRHNLIPEEAATIGRSEECSFRLSDASVSRIQCQITWNGEQLVLEDVGSRWGTQVNGGFVTSSVLKSGDCILVGDTELVVSFDAQLAATAAPLRHRPSAPTEEDLISSPPTSASPIRLSQLPGSRFDHYEVEELIARTTSGMVFRASNSTTRDEQIALKVFWPDFFREERQTQRFLRAVRTMIPLQHDNLVRLHSAGRWQGYCFTASEFVDGESVTQLVARIGVAGMLDWRRAYDVAVGAAQALEFAHERNIVHRNVRPSNLLIRDFDKCIKLGDLMLSRAIDEVDAVRLTRPGELVGDVRYLSPEQVTGEAHPDGRVDIYGLGATLYAILTGRPLFDGSTAEVMGKIVSQPPEPPTKYHLAIPPAFEGLVMRMLAKRPQDRFESTGTLLKDLRRFGKYHNLK